MSIQKKFNLELNNLPSTIKKLIFDETSCYEKNLNNLPKSLITQIKIIH